MQQKKRNERRHKIRKFKQFGLHGNPSTDSKFVSHTENVLNDHP